MLVPSSMITGRLTPILAYLQQEVGLLTLSAARSMGAEVATGTMPGYLWIPAALL